MRGKRRKLTFVYGARPYLFLLPVYILIIAFKYVPFVTAIQKSFFNWNGGNTDIFIGFANYREAFADVVFLGSLLNVLAVCVAYVVIALTIPLLAAELVFSLRSERMQYHARTAFTFPMVVPMVVTILLWKWILAGDHGILNKLLRAVGLEGLTHPWLGSSSTALGAVIAVGFPWLGIAMLGGMQFLIYYGGLQAIPRDLFEVAQIDGIGKLQRFLYIDLPMLASQFKMLITLAIIQGLQIFDTVAILTKGGPGTSTMVPSMYLYEQGFTYGRMGYSSAIGVILFMIILAFTFLNQTLLRNTEKID